MNLSTDIQNSLIDLYLATAEELQNNFSLPSTYEEIDEFLQLALRNKASSQLYLQLSRLPDAASLPVTLMKNLKETYEQIRIKNTKRLKAGIPVLLELNKKGVEVIILKGNAIAEDIYHDIGYKPMNDIDILVKKEDLNIVYEVFEQFELLTAAPLDEDAKKQEKFSHHLPPYFDKSLSVFFGTHWDISAPLRGIKTPVEDFWKEKEEFKLSGHRFYRLSPAHFLFHLCVHLNTAKTGLREVADIVKVIEANSNRLDSRNFTKMVKETGAVNDIFEALTLSFALKPTVFAKEVLDQLKVTDNKILERVTKRSSPKSKLLHIRTNYISKIEKTFAMFMLTDDPKEKTFLLAKMWKLYLLIPADEALRLNYEMPDTSMMNRLISRLKGPLKVSEVFIKDLGLPIFVIVTLRHQWVLFKAYMNFLSKKAQGKEVDNLDSFAKKLGLTFDEIKEISSLD